MNPLRCDEVKNSLVEYLEFELPLTDREKFYDHLAQCSQCRAAHDELRQVLAEVKNIDVVYPPQSYWDDLSGNVLNEIQQLREATVNNKTDSFIEVDSPGHDVSYKENRANTNVIVFSEIRSRKVGEPAATPVSQGEQVVKSPASPEARRPTARRWPIVVLPIAAAVLIGIATTFSLLERQTSIYSDTVADKIGFQAQIQSEQSLAELARNVAPLSQPGNQFGFTSRKALFNEFSIGSLFSEAKAYAATAQAVELKTYLALLKAALQNEVSPQSEIINGITQIQLRLKTQSDFVQANNELTRLLNDYIAAIKRQDVQRYNLARAGAWLFDYALAVIAKDKVSIRQLDELAQLTTALQAAGAPPGVLKSLNKMQAIVKQPTIVDRDYQNLLQEVENIRSLLG
ncbi:MAG: hypothetical protein AMJ55_13395 [Gammaproteobacteria bacterium SG8_15]|nr:MAG: hypothetical protein AMJ55_13395 [Gammaproteobacteria bacterium SG8_15]